VYDLFQDSNGGFSTFLRNDDGDQVAMRTPDGAHYTWDGAYRLSARVAGIIADDWGLELPE